MALIFSNNALSKLAQPLTAGQTTLTIQTGTGSLFPSPSGGDYFKLTIEDRRTQQIEITHCIGRAGDVLTVVRAREDMTAQDFLVDATVSNRFTRDTPDAILEEVPNANPWYLGPFAVAPTTDNDGDPLQAGMSYFNTSDTRVYYWTGATWLDPVGVEALTTASGVFLLQDIAGDFDGVETVFDLRYTDYSAATQTPDVTIAEQFVVWLDGVAQIPGVDFVVPSLGNIEFAIAPVADAQFHGVWIALTHGLPGAGTGDMTRLVYDTDNDGIVDVAETVQFGGVNSIPTQRYLGRQTAGTGAAEALSKAQMQSGLEILPTIGGVMSGTLDMNDNLIDEPTLRNFGLRSNATVIVAGVLPLDFDNGNAVDVDVDDDITLITVAHWKPSGDLSKMTAVLKNDGVGGHTIDWPVGWRWPGGVVPTYTTDPNKDDILVIMSVDAGTTVYVTLAGQGY